MNSSIETITNDLIRLEENEWLEFKSYWYWSNNEKNRSKGWGEFLKDFSALINTNSEVTSKKYLICGFDEKKRECQDYNIDINKEQISLFSKLSDAKNKIIAKLKTHFKNTPLYQDSDDLINIESVFDLHTVRINNKNVLVIEIFPAPYLLEIKELLQSNESFREGNIIIRTLKSDNTPENKNATTEKILLLKDSVLKSRVEYYPSRNLSIRSTVEAFKDKYFPSSNCAKIAESKKSSSGLYFEIYSITGEYSTPFDFLYFSKYTSRKATIEYILQANYVAKGIKKIFLIDEFNPKGGIADKQRLEKQAKEHWKEVEVYYLEEFSLQKIYNGLFDPNIFHQGNFNIKNFVQPFTEEISSKSADILLKEWYAEVDNPLLVIKGTGGIGKTTVLKYFLDILYKDIFKDERANILFISSHEIINEIMRHTSVEDLFDFYAVVAEKNSVGKRFNKKLLELSIDNGNLIIALDGLDEVITKMGSKFNVNTFIEAIFSNYSHNLAKSKIIITCRDYFWDKNNISRDIKTITLSAFNEELTKKYFSYFFDSGKLDKALSLANHFAISREDKNIYIPYILDMISENLLDDFSSGEIDSNLLLPAIFTNDYLVGKVCEREVIKLETLPIDEQINLFTNIATDFDGVIHHQHFKGLKDSFGRKYSGTAIEKFKGHPLIINDEKGETIRFRYDFFTDYFKTISLSSFLKKEVYDNISDELIDVIIDHISYDNSFTKAVLKRIEELDLENLQYRILNFTQKVIPALNINKEISRRINSSLFLLILAKDKVCTVDSRTALLKDFYADSDGNIEKLHIINLHSSNKAKPIFDFKSIKFTNCHFENYEYFFDCKYDLNTHFSYCTFIGPLNKENSTTKMTLDNFDFSTCDDFACIEEQLKQKYSALKEREDGKINEIKKVIRFFWSNGAFKNKLASEIRKKFKSRNDIIDKLIKNKVIITTTTNTRQKRNDLIYLINPYYSNLRKIIEENQTCNEFEKIVTFFYDSN
ncbi:RNA-binding domain-containing protein [Desulfocastanea catecholica]